MIKRKCRAKRCHRVGKPVGVHGYNVGIPLAHNNFARLNNAVFCLVNGVEMLAFMKQRRFFCVEVFWFAVVDNTATKANAFALLIVDGKHNAVKKTAAKPIRACMSNVTRKQLFSRKTAACKLCNKVVVAFGIANRPRLANVACKTTIMKIAARGRRFLLRTGK